jgi:hypothetical protein
MWAFVCFKTQKTIDIFHGYANLLTGIFVSNPFPLKLKNAWGCSMTRVEISKDPSGRIIASSPCNPLLVSKVKTFEARRWHPGEKFGIFRSYTRVSAECRLRRSTRLCCTGERFSVRRCPKINGKNCQGGEKVRCGTHHHKPATP